MTMRVKLPRAFRFGFTGTPIDKTMVNTHRDFGPVKDRQAGALPELLRHPPGDQGRGDAGGAFPVSARCPLAAEEQPLNVDFEQMCDEMELEDEEEKDFLQRKEVRWKALARHPDGVAKIVENLVTHFLEHPDPSGFKAQLVCIDRPACAQYKDALDAELKKRGILDGPAWSEVIISEAQNDPPELERFHYGKEKTDKLIDYFKLTPAQWEAWNRQQFGDDKEQVEAAAENPDRLRPAADRLRRARRASDVPGQAAARPQLVAGDGPDQPAVAGDGQAHRRHRRLLRRLREPAAVAELRREELSRKRPSTGRSSRPGARGGRPAA